MHNDEQHLAYDFEFSHIVKEINIPVTIYASRNSTEGKFIKIDAIWDTGATNSVISPYIFEELGLDSIDKSINIEASRKNAKTRTRLFFFYIYRTAFGISSYLPLLFQ